MLFNSLNYFIFFILTTLAYFNLPHKYRWFLLLAGSCYFYMSFVPIYILILIFTVVVDYFGGIFIETAFGRKRKLFLIASLCANIGVLSFFKYFNFLNENLTILLQAFTVNNQIPFLSILLPIGLSFHTFQAMSYTIEVYRGNQTAERNFGVYLLYVMFYPQLVAGPIERPQNLIHQFYEKHHFEYVRIVAGLKLILWGLFKKVVVADRLAIYVNAVYNNSNHHSGQTLMVATIFFAFQIYCDFSGYSDIAIGSAKILGFELMTNFQRPYLSKNISEFWQRWHISLSSWFKDYLYISLGGNRRSLKSWYFNIMIVFFVSGLWHGANWTFIIWGTLNGLYFVLSHNTAKLRNILNEFIGLNKIPKIKSVMQIILTFSLTCLSWVFFRANNVNDALNIIKKMILFDGPIYHEHVYWLVYSIFGILMLMLCEIKQEYYQGKFNLFNNNNWVIRNISYAAVTIIILLIGVFDGGQFIYFQF